MTGPAATILVADDDGAVRTVLSRALDRAGFTVRATGDASTLWQWVDRGDGDLVITDVLMPDGNGLDLIPRMLRARPDLRILVVSAHNTLLTAVRAAERGAFDYLPKPFDVEELVSTVRRALTSGRGMEADGGAPADADDRPPLIGRSQPMQEVYRAVARLVGTDLTVLITGESGTGKELVARALHDYGKRREHPFVAVNMAAIPRELIESELFGHERGAFTGATCRFSGRFEQARGGTLFLDEIGDMPADAQTRLLRVLQDGEYTTVGGRAPLIADARIIAATHRNLAELIDQRLFREDLYYRLNVVPLRVPPLRERVEDIAELIEHFFAEAKAAGLPWKVVDRPALDRLKRHTWPGNVRELENLVRRLAALYPEDVIGLDVIEGELPGCPMGMTEAREEGLSRTVEQRLDAYFSAHGRDLPAPGLYHRVLREVERPLIELTLKATRGNQIRAADVLGLNRNTLRKKIRELGIQVVRGGR